MKTGGILAEKKFQSAAPASDPRSQMRYAIPSVTLMIAGAELIFASFVLSFIEPASAAGGAIV